MCRGRQGVRNRTGLHSTCEQFWQAAKPSSWRAVPGLTRGGRKARNGVAWNAFRLRRWVLAYDIETVHRHFRAYPFSRPRFAGPPLLTYFAPDEDGARRTRRVAEDAGPDEDQTGCKGVITGRFQGRHAGLPNGRHMGPERATTSSTDDPQSRTIDQGSEMRSSTAAKADGHGVDRRVQKPRCEVAGAGERGRRPDSIHRTTDGHPACRFHRLRLSECSRFSSRQELAVRALGYDRRPAGYLIEPPERTVVALAEGLQTSSTASSLRLGDQFPRFTGGSPSDDDRDATFCRHRPPRVAMCRAVGADFQMDGPGRTQDNGVLITGPRVSPELTCNPTMRGPYHPNAQNDFPAGR